MTKYTAFIAALSLAAGAMAQPLIDPSRTTAWNPGLNAAGGIPNRTTVCATVSPLGGGLDDSANIQASIDACPAGQVVSLAAGTFTISDGNLVLINKGITLRGAGPALTIIQRTDGAHPNTEATGLTPSPHIIVGPARFYDPTGEFATNLTADAVKETTSITVASSTGLSAGDFVLLDELSGASFQTDPAGRGQIWASADFRVVWQLHNPAQGTDDPLLPTTPTSGNAASWFSRQDRPTSEVKRIASVVANTITFTTPIHISYRVSHTAQLYHYSTPTVFTTFAGVENLKLSNADNGQLRFQWCGYCWAKSIDNTVWHDEGFAVDSSFGVEIRDSYVHDAAWAQPGGAGYAISLSAGSSEVLIENNISVMANKVMVARSAGAGSVVGYNYVEDGYINTNGNWQEIGLNASHMVGSHHVLFEGNYGFNWDSDKTHGNAIYHTVFRNHLRGIRKAFNNPNAPTANWAPLTAYTVGQTVWNGSGDSAFQCTGAGTSGPPPGPPPPPPDGTVMWTQFPVGIRVAGTFQQFDDFNQQSINGPLRTAGAAFYSYWHSYVGNVLGLSGQMTGWVYENTAGVLGSPAIWMLGWDDWCPDGAGTPGCYPNDSNVAATAYRHGNWDYVQNVITWDPTNVNHTLPNSLYLAAKPAFFTGGASTWPWVIPDGAIKLFTLPAKARFDAGTPFTQP